MLSLSQRHGDNMKRQYKILGVLIVICFLIWMMPTDNAEAKINIVGSTSIQPICERLVEEYEKTHSGVDINIQGGGTSLGIKCANLSVADIGMSSKNINCSNLLEYKIGSEAIVVVVNKNNPINDLSTSQIKDIFSGKIRKWDDVCHQSGDINVVVREEGSGTLDAFKETIMNTSKIKKDAIIQNSPGSIKQSVMNDKNAIGFVALSHVDDSIKSISIDGVKASRDSILDDSYKLKRPFLFLTNNNPSNETLNFIQWMHSNEAKEILESEKIF